MYLINLILFVITIKNTQNIKFTDVINMDIVYKDVFIHHFKQIYSKIYIFKSHLNIMYPQQI